MLRLHYYSDNPALAAPDDEESVYSIDLIKEFEAVGRAWKAFLDDWIHQGVCLCHPRCGRVYDVTVCFCFMCTCALDVVGVYTKYDLCSESLRLESRVSLCAIKNSDNLMAYEMLIRIGKTIMLSASVFLNTQTFVRLSDHFHSVC